uniref:Uncharacterized protein n=1 Tax=Trichogramma kaykai TaxID=54128 RepID=A0ABD2X4I4_9HYME
MEDENNGGRGGSSNGSDNPADVAGSGGGVVREAALEHAPALTEEYLREHGIPLHQAIQQFEAWWSSLTCVAAGSTPRFVVDGQAPLRQCLHPEACNKHIELPAHYCTFHDLRKEFAACYSSNDELSMLGIQDMIESAAGDRGEICQAHTCTNCTKASSVRKRTTAGNSSRRAGLVRRRRTCIISEFAFRGAVDTRIVARDIDGPNVALRSEPMRISCEAQDMVAIIQRMIKDGHVFNNSEVVNIVLEPGICSKDEKVDNFVVVRARGLPWQSSDQDVAKFFRGLNVAK